MQAKWNRLLATLALVMYVFSYNGYFGYHWSPKSPEECICDGITMFATVFILMIRDYT